MKDGARVTVHARHPRRAASLLRDERVAIEPLWDPHPENENTVPEVAGALLILAPLGLDEMRIADRAL